MNKELSKIISEKVTKLGFKEYLGEDFVLRVPLDVLSSNSKLYDKFMKFVLSREIVTVEGESYNWFMYSEGNNYVVKLLDKNMFY